MLSLRKMIVAIALLAGSFSYLSTNHAATTFTYFDAPNAVDTIPFAIYQDTVVGTYTDSSSKSHAFIKTGNTYTTLENPAGGSVIPHGVYGDSVAGQWIDSANVCHGFIYNHNQFNIIDVPASTSTAITGIYADSFVGNYASTSGKKTSSTRTVSSSILLTQTI